MHPQLVYLLGSQGYGKGTCEQRFLLFFHVVGQIALPSSLAFEINASNGALTYDKPGGQIELPRLDPFLLVAQCAPAMMHMTMRHGVQL